MANRRREWAVFPPADVSFVLNLSNRDAGILHNLHPTGLEGVTICHTSTAMGALDTSYRFLALPIGSCHFHCDLHVETMDGVLTVK